MSEIKSKKRFSPRELAPLNVRHREAECKNYEIFCYILGFEIYAHDHEK